MKLIIAGGRDYELSVNDYVRLYKLHGHCPVTEVVSGAQLGADRCGEFWASECRIPVKRFPADWKAHGRAAGPIRNRQMAEYADAVVLFPGGKGTENMCREARKAGIEIYDYRQVDA